MEKNYNMILSWLVLPNLQLFSLTLNDVLLATHVDLFALSTGSGRGVKPINIMTNFKVETKRVHSHVSTHRRTISIISFKGSSKVVLALATRQIFVGFCISECRLCDEYSTIDPGYVLAGLSLVRFPLNTWSSNLKRFNQTRNRKKKWSVLKILWIGYI